MNIIKITNQYDADKLKEMIEENIVLDSIYFDNKNTPNTIVLPENIKCRVFIAEEEQNLVLPENLNCENLNIHGCSISHIPKSTIITSKLNAIRTKNLVLPMNFKLGTLNISGSETVILPENLCINGYLVRISVTDCINTLVIPYGTYIKESIISDVLKSQTINGYVLDLAPDNYSYNVMRTRHD